MKSISKHESRKLQVKSFLLVILLKLSLQRNHHFFAKEQLIYVTSCKLLYRHWSCRKENLELMSRT
ncbi:hypothetical protein CDAR_593961, partial [Caerostris darwini]